MSTPGSQINNDINQWQTANSGYNSMVAAYRSFMAHMKQNFPDAAARFWAFQMEAMPDLIAAQQYRVEGFAQVQNVATILRSAVTEAQNAYAQLNQAFQGQAPTVIHALTPSELNAASAVKAAMDQLKSLLNEAHMGSVIGSGNIANLLQNINQFWSAFGGSGVNKSQIAGDIASWVQQAEGGATSTPEIQGLNNNFQNLNQILSGTSTQVQTEMQATMQNIQQYLGIYKSDFDTTTQLMTYIVQNSNTTAG